MKCRYCNEYQIYVLIQSKLPKPYSGRVDRAYATATVDLGSIPGVVNLMLITITKNKERKLEQTLYRTFQDHY